MYTNLLGTIFFCEHDKDSRYDIENDDGEPDEQSDHVDELTGYDEIEDDARDNETDIVSEHDGAAHPP